MSNDWRILHKEAMSKFLKYLNEKSDSYILKGGTSLMMCYNLDRFSEDIDLDGTHSKSIHTIVDSFCKKEKFSYRVAKDTDTVNRFMINYGVSERPLKVEVSYRKKHIEKSEYLKIGNIMVYNIESICMMKVNAYMSRDKIRDLYDLTFICNNYWDKLSPNVKSMVRNCVEYKGLEQFDYLIKQQSDELIDNDKLLEDFLQMYDKLDLSIGENEQKFITTERNGFNLCDSEQSVSPKIPLPAEATQQQAPSRSGFPLSRAAIKKSAEIIRRKEEEKSKDKPHEKKYDRNNDLS